MVLEEWNELGFFVLFILRLILHMEHDASHNP